jgi:hypothetical protein
MKEMLSCLCYTTAMSIICFAVLQAETTEVVLSNSMRCTKEELMRFFPEQVVQSILIKAHLPKDQAEAMAHELSQKDQELARIVEEKASKIEPNPFKSLSQRDLAIRIYRETLYEVFAKVLQEHGVTNKDQIQALLDELQETRSKLFIECIRKQGSKSSGPSSS